MKIALLGDIHGTWRELNRAFRKCEDEGVKTLLQVGDFGYYSRMGQIWPPKHLVMPHDITCYWIDGNHEGHWQIRDNCSPTEPTKVYDYGNIFYWPRGYVLSIDGFNILGIGGAESYGGRGILGRDWFQEESITHRNLETALKNCEGKTIDMVISHDCPNHFKVNEEFRKRAEGFSAPSRHALDTILETIKPKFWMAGHYHLAMHGQHEETTWRCVAKNETVVFDTSIGFA